MSHACTPILVGVASQISEILLLSKMAKFPFPTIHGHQKIWLLRISSKKIMQVEVDVTCMHTSFGGCVFLGFRDITTFKNVKISLSDHGL